MTVRDIGHHLQRVYGTAWPTRDGFDREWGIFSETALAFIRATQPKEWVNRDARRQTECTIVLVKERRTVLIAAAVTGRITIRESMEDTLHGKCGGNMRC